MTIQLNRSIHGTCTKFPRFRSRELTTHASFIRYFIARSRSRVQLGMQHSSGTGVLDSI
jgi:hypothetical protein